MWAIFPVCVIETRASVGKRMGGGIAVRRHTAFSVSEVREGTAAGICHGNPAGVRTLSFAVAAPRAGLRPPGNSPGRVRRNPDVFSGFLFCSRVAGCGRRAERWDEAAEHAGKAFGGGTAGRRLPSSVGTARARMRKGIRALRRPGGRVGPAGKGFAKG